MGAAAHICEIAKEAAGRDRIETALLASPPGLQIFREAGLPVQRFRGEPVESASDPGANRVLAEARAWLEKIRPDAIVVGTSGPELGVDEALVACARTPHTYAFQDYSGWIVRGFGQPANTYFVLDRSAAKLTARRHPGAVVVAGSAKHATYGRLDPDKLRESARKQLGGTGPVLGFYGQPAWFLSGYPRMLERLASAIAAVRPDATVFYRPHPKESAEQRRRGLRRFQEAGLGARHDPWAEVERSLCAVDVVATGFSSCGADQIYLQRRAKRPLGAVVYLMFEPDLRRHHHLDTNVEVPDAAGQGLALIAESGNEVEDCLRRALDPATRESLWRRARTRLPDPAGAADTVLRTVLADVEGKS